MKTVALALMVFSGMLFAADAAADDAAPRTVTVEGRSSVSAAPDIARITMGISHRDPSMRVARDEVVRVSAAFLALTKRLGIPENKVQTSGLMVQPEYRWDRNTEQQQLIGYSAQRELAVELEALDRLGELIEGALDSGVNQVSPPAFDTTRRGELHRQALGAASADARANAQYLATSLGLRLGPARTVDATVIRPVMPIVARGAIQELSMDARPVETYNAGEIRIEAQVTVTFDLLVDQE